MKILVTGFDPFGDDAINPSWEAVKKLPNAIAGAEIAKREIPTVFNKSAEVTRKMIEEEDPDYILNVGQAGGRFDITPERIAINIDDARIPDNEKNQPFGETIQENGDSAYFTQLPIKAMATAMKKAGIPASVSNTAGTFVCNHIMYQVQYMIANEFRGIKGGYIHVPFIPEQTVNKPSSPSMSLDTIALGLEKSIEAIVEFDGKPDLKEIGTSA